MRQGGKALGVGARGDCVEPQEHVLEDQRNAGDVAGSRTLGGVHEGGQVVTSSGLVGDALGQGVVTGGPGRALCGILARRVTALFRSSHIVHSETHPP